jgi:hypothetical protein
MGTGNEALANGVTFMERQRASVGLTRAIIASPYSRSQRRGRQNAGWHRLDVEPRRLLHPSLIRD